MQVVAEVLAEVGEDAALGSRGGGRFGAVTVPDVARQDQELHVDAVDHEQ